MKNETTILGLLALIVLLLVLIASNIQIAKQAPETIDALKVCAKVHEDFWRDQCYSDIAKDLAKREEYRK
jgi:hypothetical protein